MSSIDKDGLLFIEGWFAIYELGWNKTMIANDLGDKAYKIASDSGLEGEGNGPQDAYRHCLWSCLMSKEIGIDDANLAGYLHEEYGGSTGLSANGPGEFDMDMHNNISGQYNSEKSCSCTKSCMTSYKGGWLQVLSEDRWIN